MIMMETTPPVVIFLRFICRRSQCVRLPRIQKQLNSNSTLVNQSTHMTQDDASVVDVSGHFENSSSDDMGPFEIQELRDVNQQTVVFLTQ
jgi:hypothetical protein